MKVASQAALGTLSVSTKELETDTLLQLVVHVASSLQLTVKTSPKAAVDLSLELPDGCTVLRQRNAIIRCLCGMGLHNALDDALMGGHFKAVKSSPGHAMALAATTSWMSVADHARHHPEQSASLLDQVEAHLETRAFLIPSATVTIADIDVAMVIMSNNDASSSIASYPNVHRWLLAVASFLEEKGLPGSPLASVEPIAKSHSAPLFFYGTEDVPLPQAKKKAPPAAAANNNKKQQQQAGGGGGAKQEQQQQKQGKKEKQPKQQAQEQQQPAGFDISALDIRVGKILKVWEHPDAEKLYCEEIDVGEDQPRQIASGLRPFYASPSDLQDAHVMVLCNLKKRSLVGFPSHGMVMCASNADHSAVEIMAPPANAKIGERIVFEGFEDKEPEPENKVAKKKIFEGLAPDLKTNDQGICVWKTAVSKTSGGPVKASKGMANAHVA